MRALRSSASQHDKQIAQTAGWHQRQLVPHLVPSDLMLGDRAGRGNLGIPASHVLALAMGLHRRLGLLSNSPIVRLDSELLREIVDACRSEPETRAGRVEGWARMMGLRKAGGIEIMVQTMRAHLRREVQAEARRVL